MIVIAKEEFSGVVVEAKELVEQHYKELTLNKEAMELFPNWDKYFALDADSSLVLITARDDGKLVGYSLFILSPHLHYKKQLVAYNDVLFLHNGVHFDAIFFFIAVQDHAKLMNHRSILH